MIAKVDGEGTVYLDNGEDTGDLGESDKWRTEMRIEKPVGQREEELSIPEDLGEMRESRWSGSLKRKYPLGLGTLYTHRREPGETEP